jgi:hypothetical protein
MTKKELIEAMKDASDDTRVVIENKPNEIMDFYNSDIVDVLIYKPGKKNPNGLVVLEND